MSQRFAVVFSFSFRSNEIVWMVLLQSARWAEDGAVCVLQLKGHITPVRTLAFSPDGLALASGGVGGLMNIWSLRVRGEHLDRPDFLPPGLTVCFLTDRTDPSCRQSSPDLEPSRTLSGSQMWAWPSAPTGRRSDIGLFLFLFSIAFL